MKQTNILLQEGSLHILGGKFFLMISGSDLIMCSPRLLSVIPWKIAVESAFTVP
jgi:hypothetical protein